MEIIQLSDSGVSAVVSGDLYRQALETTADGFIFIDSGGSIQAFDPKFRQLVGEPVTEEAVRRFFPSGCAPFDVLAARNRRTGVRYCDLRGKPARVAYFTSEAGLLTVVSKLDRAPESELESISGDFIDAQLDERRNISRYLHDTVSQCLVVLALSLGKLQRASSPNPADFTQALILVDRCCRDLRVISYALAPPVFDDIGLAAAFEWYTRHLRDDAGIAVRFISETVPENIPPGVRKVMFAIVQEWAEKAVRYRDAGSTVISLNEAGQELVLKFACNQTVDEAVTGILASRVIRERVRILQGTLETMQDDGLTAVIRIPVT